MIHEIFAFCNLWILKSKSLIFISYKISYILQAINEVDFNKIVAHYMMSKMIDFSWIGHHEWLVLCYRK